MSLETKFTITSEERVDALTILLRDEVIPKFGLKMTGAAWRDPQGRDLADCKILMDGREVGAYSFEKAGGTYHCTLTGTDARIYYLILSEIKNHVPEIQ